MKQGFMFDLLERHMPNLRRGLKMKSPREQNIDKELIWIAKALNLSERALNALNLILSDDEIQASQEYANTVSIIRLGYNDHGPVHMRTVALNSVIMLDLLKKAGINTSLENDKCGDFEDSVIAVIFACILHDLGMGMGRVNHELHSTILASPILNRLLDKVYGNDLQKKTMVRALAMECIAGHMGTISITSLEAGVVQVADGCDMSKGRARIPIALNYSALRTGHIHQYSANSIIEVKICAGNEKPIRVDVLMDSEVGLFQVEEVLLHKIANSTAKPYIELYAKVNEQNETRYL
jgi:metal-dependent HD superfamily phosphatase/phosphodiesterase